MGVHYTFDAELDSVLQAASNEDLDPLVEFIQQAHVSENLTSSAEFKRFYPDHKRYVHIISHDLRAFGGHALANLLRHGRGPDYRTVVCDVAKRFKIQFDEDAPLPQIEQKILAHVMKELYGKMSEEQKQLFVQELEQYQGDDHGGAMVVQAVEKEDFGALSPKVVTLLSAVVNQAISSIMGANALITRVSDSLSSSFNRLQSIMSMPLTWLANMFYAIYDFGGPAYRVTVPCVLHIAMLRIKQSSNLIAYQSPVGPQLTAAAPAGAAPADAGDTETEAQAEAKAAAAPVPAPDTSTIQSTSEDPESSQETVSASPDEGVSDRDADK